MVVNAAHCDPLLHQCVDAAILRIMLEQAIDTFWVLVLPTLWFALWVSGNVCKRVEFLW